jgi:hypothetical protein
MKFFGCFKSTGDKISERFFREISRKLLTVKLRWNAYYWFAVLPDVRNS